MEKIYRGDGKWAEYEYDGTSARVGKTVGTASSEETETTKYYNMGATVLNEVSSEEGNTTNLIGAGIEARMSVTGSSITSAYFLQKNAHGDVTAAISGTERAATYDYDAFGNTLVEEGEINNPIRYSGEYLDEETGLIYLRARYYDPSVGRFISEDTHWNPTNMIYGDKEYEEGETKIPNIASILQSSNLYAYACDIIGTKTFFGIFVPNETQAYCGNSPVNFYDCNGMWMEGDEKLSFGAQMYTIAYGNDWETYNRIYENASTDEERQYAQEMMDYYHERAEDIRALDAQGKVTEVYYSVTHVKQENNGICFAASFVMVDGYRYGYKPTTKTAIDFAVYQKSQGTDEQLSRQEALDLSNSEGGVLPGRHRNPGENGEKVVSVLIGAAMPVGVKLKSTKGGTGHVIVLNGAAYAPGHDVVVSFHDPNRSDEVYSRYSRMEEYYEKRGFEIDDLIIVSDLGAWYN